MLPIRSSFTTLEQSALHAICKMYSADRSALEAQLATATVFRRENTGAGFYTHFFVEQSSSAAIGGERLRAGPPARLDGLEHGMGFVLWLKDGYAACLEGYSYGESTKALDLERIAFEILPSQT